MRQVRPDYNGTSTQGYYVLGADGSGYLVDNYPPRMREFLTRGVEQFRRRRPGAASVTDEELAASAPSEPPEGASIVRLFTRVEPGAGTRAATTYLNRDYMWVLRDEVRAMVRASGRRGAQFDLPPTLVGRLVVFHMVDGTRGQVWPWQPGSVSQARFTARAVGDKDGVRSFEFSGEFAKRDSHPPQWTERRQEGSLDGEFDIDLATETIVRFRAFARSTAFTDATYDRASTAPRGDYTLLTAIVEATDDLARQITPEPAATGDYYLRVQVPNR